MSDSAAFEITGTVHKVRALAGSGPAAGLPIEVDAVLDSTHHLFLVFAWGDLAEELADTLRPQQEVSISGSFEASRQHLDPGLNTVYLFADRVAILTQARTADSSSD